MVAGADGTSDFLGGQNQALTANRIAPNQYWAGLNVTTRGGLGERPKFHEVEIKVLSTGGITINGGTKLFSDIFRTGKFQALNEYVSQYGSFLVAIISGVVFRVDTDAKEAYVYADLLLDEYQDRYNTEPAGKYFIIHDEPDFPIYLDGYQWHRADPALFEIPVTNLGVFNQSRLIVANSSNELGASDPVALGFPKAPISFLESLAPAAPYLGQFWTVGAGSTHEPITYLGNLQVVDNSTGYGPLIVGTSKQVWTFRTDFPRSGWGQTAGWGSIILSNTGIAGPRAAVNVNSDFFFMGTDGLIRSLSSARDEQGRWSNTGISEEIKRQVRYIDDDYKRFCVTGEFNNRIFFSVNPYKLKAKDNSNNDVFDIAHKGLAVMELANVAGLTYDAPPVWEGLWTGIYPQEIVKHEEKLFFWSKNPSFKNTLYQLKEGETYDITGKTKRLVKSRVYTRGYRGPQGAESLDKKDGSLDLFFRHINVRTGLKVSAYKKALHQGDYFPWNEVEITNDIKTCPLNFVDTGIKTLSLGTNTSKDCDKALNETFGIWKEAQFMFEMEGNFKLDSILIKLEVLGTSGAMQNLCKTQVGGYNLRNCDLVSDMEFYSAPGTLKSVGNKCQGL